MILALNILIKLCQVHTHSNFAIWFGCDNDRGAHTVGLSAGDNTPLFNIVLISLFMMSYSAMGTFLGSESAKGFASSFSLMEYLIIEN